MQAYKATASRFDGVTLNDLCNLFDGLQAAYHVLSINEWNTNGTVLVGSHLWFKAEAERINVLMQEIADVALERQPADADEEWEREQILIRAKPYRSGCRRYRTRTTVEVR